MARVLIVDDEYLVRRGLHRLLETAGHEVWETSGAKVALDLLEHEPMDLVITDIYMPGMNGIEFIARLGQSPARSSRVIAMTGGGHRSPGDLLNEAAAVGAERILAKPFPLRQFEEAVDAVLHTQGSVRVAAQTVAVTTRTTGGWMPTVQDLAEH